VKDAYALPRIDDILDSLHGNRYYTVLDMKSVYHQIEIEEIYKECTVFTVGPLGFYEYQLINWNFLALKWAITEKFKDYLYGSKFTAITDNNQLTYIFANTKLDGTDHRWVAA
jgi:hypothetical protein